jgi:hypothetical protein
MRPLFIWIIAEPVRERIGVERFDDRELIHVLRQVGQGVRAPKA